MTNYLTTRQLDEIEDRARRTVRMAQVLPDWRRLDAQETLDLLEMARRTLAAEARVRELEAQLAEVVQD